MERLAHGKLPKKKVPTEAAQSGRIVLGFGFEKNVACAENRVVIIKHHVFRDTRRLGKPGRSSAFPGWAP